MSELTLPFTSEDLSGYLTLRATGLAHKTVTWLKKAAQLLWNATTGVISVSSMSLLRHNIISKYRDIYAKRKTLGFARAFLRYLSKSKFDERYAAFDLFLELPRAVKERKHVTSRIVTIEDIENILSAIKQAYCAGDIDSDHYLNFMALVLFGAFTGQRPLATIARLKVGQFKEAMKLEKPVVDVFPEQDKIRMQHYCPLHPQVVGAMLPLLDGQPEEEPVFKQLSFQRWLKQNEIRLLRSDFSVVNGDLRKFAEQYGDIIEWEESNRKYVLTHGVSGVEWSHYKNPLPDSVYDVYMKYWGGVSLKI
ncbi:MAG: hypothetical protein WCG09_02405 [Halobacteriota archaeon]